MHGTRPERNEQAAMAMAAAALFPAQVQSPPLLFNLTRVLT
ncbi:hypothetical protein EJMOOK_15315 [Rhodanobacter sp. Root179]